MTTRPFDIPELRDHLSKFLGEKELFNCIFACKAWHSSFIPVLYYNTSITQNTRNPKPESIKQNFVHVRTLTIKDFSNPAYYPLEFRNLTTLKVTYGPPLPSCTKKVLPATFISQMLTNSKDTLKSFTFSCLILIDEVQTIWESLFSCTKITHLDLVAMTSISINRGNIDRFISLISQVTSLRLQYITMLYNGNIAQIPLSLVTSSNLVNLECCRVDLNFFSIILLHLICMSPHVKSVRWENRDRRARSEIASQYNEHVFRKLMPITRSKSFNTLEINGRLSDEDLGLLIRAMSDANELRLEGHNFGEESYHALLENHFNSITILDIMNCFDVSGSMIQGILSNCPSLISLSADHIRGTDLVRIEPPTYGGSNEQEGIILGEDWVCLNLRELRLFFDLGSDDGNVDLGTIEGRVFFRRLQKLRQYHSFRQISRLHSLHTLDITPIYQSLNTTTLNISLKSNGGELDQLCTLRDLRNFRRCHTIGEREKEWMREHWFLDDEF